ncbi:uncharacterized protein GBIM_14501 [Gryllus bimaculatus]|nr:uncharacterized protein GBIM_14501 [Gryllus bimaculatus]
MGHVEIKLPSFHTIKCARSGNVKCVLLERQQKLHLLVAQSYSFSRLRIRYVMPSAHLTLREEDVVRLALEFLHTRDLHISQLSLERETGVINGAYSDDVLFLRQLILDGQWDDVLEFIQPLEALPNFDMRRFRFLILRHKYVELLCIKSEAAGAAGSMDSAVEDVVKVLNELERVAPSKEEYSNLCLMLTLPRLSDHLQYKDWNPSNARVQCFREVFPLVEHFLPGEKKASQDPSNPQPTPVTAKNDRLIHLIIKGILYESCVNYCQAKATGSKESQTQEMSFSKLLDGAVGYSDSDLSLLSWLQSIPPETFSVPFEQRTLNVDIERLERPSLETSWTEHMLVTPIKPKLFPHSAMPFTRPRSAADIMSRSLLPALDGLPFGLAEHQQHQHGPGANAAAHLRNHSPMMALSTGDINTGSNAMSRSSFASFHLTGYKNNKLMNTSVDRLFENDDDVFLSSNYAEFQQLPAIQEGQQQNVAGAANHVPAAGAKSTAPNAPPEPRPFQKPPTKSCPLGHQRCTRRRSLLPADPPRATRPANSAALSTARAPPAAHRSANKAQRTTVLSTAPAEHLQHQHHARCGRCGRAAHAPVLPPPAAAALGPGAGAAAAVAVNGTNGTNGSFDGDLLKEYQRQKQRLQETLQQKEREREELVRQLAVADNRLQENSLKKFWKWLPPGIHICCFLL